MKREIASGGPISCLIYATDAFHAYKGGIMNSTIEAIRPNHAVELTGWSAENGTEFWIIRNRQDLSLVVSTLLIILCSWGTYWGEAGWARVAVGPGDFGLSKFPCDWAKPKGIHTPDLTLLSSLQKAGFNLT